MYGVHQPDSRRWTKQGLGFHSKLRMFLLYLLAWFDDVSELNYHQSVPQLTHPSLCSRLCILSINYPLIINI